MNYLPLDQYSKAWIFRHRDLPVPAEDLEQIRPLTEQRAEQIWAEHISRGCSHPEQFSGDDWAGRDNSWIEGDYWQSAWDSNKPDLPEVLGAHLKEWDDNTKVFFCYHSDHIIETSWGVWRRHWKNFLFFFFFPILIGRKRKRAAQFFDNGNYRIGLRG